MKFCHFVTKHFYTLCNVEPGEDTTIILFTNINGTFFYLKMTFFRARRKKCHFTFCQKTETESHKAAKRA